MQEIYFFEVGIDGEDLKEQKTLVDVKLCAVSDKDGEKTLLSTDCLYDLGRLGELGVRSWELGGGNTNPNSQIPIPNPPTVAEQQELEKWLKVRVQYPMLKKARGQRTKDLNIRLEYLHQAMKSAIEEAQRQQMKLAGKVAAGEEGYRMARDNAQNKVRSLNERYQNKQKELESLGRVKSGLVKYLGTALVCPPPPEITTGGMRNDPEVKALVMNYVMEYERARGWEPEDISQKGDSSGFDIRSIGPIDEVTGNCAIRRIEVKGRANINEEVSLTANEWRRAQQLGDTYWLYVVWGCKTGNLQLLTIQDPAEVLAADVKEVKQVTRYVIGERALRQFSSIE